MIWNAQYNILKRISFVAYGYESDDESFGITDSAKVEFVNGLVLFLSIKDLNNREIVAVSKDGEDYYYPDGYIEIDFDYLNKYQK